MSIALAFGLSRSWMSGSEIGVERDKGVVLIVAVYFVALRSGVSFGYQSICMLHGWQKRLSVHCIFEALHRFNLCFI